MNRFMVLALMLALASGASAQRKTDIVESTNISQEEGMVLKRKVAIGRFSNETQYAKGIFYDRKNDPRENKHWISYLLNWQPRASSYCLKEATCLYF